MKKYKTLYEVLASQKDPSACESFMKDLCTPAELQAMQGRWLVCQMLAYEPAKSYAQIHQETGVSITTIARVARFLKQEPNGGYRSHLEERH